MFNQRGHLTSHLSPSLCLPFSSHSVKAHVGKKSQPCYFQLKFPSLLYSLIDTWITVNCSITQLHLIYLITTHFTVSALFKVNCTSMSTAEVKRSLKSHHLNVVKHFKWSTRKSNLHWQINRDINVKSVSSQRTVWETGQSHVMHCGISWGPGWCNVLHTPTLYVRLFCVNLCFVFEFEFFTIRSNFTFLDKIYIRHALIQP